jgi:hypothetical protein
MSHGQVLRYGPALAPGRPRAASARPPRPMRRGRCSGRACAAAQEPSGGGPSVTKTFTSKADARRTRTHAHTTQLRLGPPTPTLPSAPRRTRPQAHHPPTLPPTHPTHARMHTRTHTRRDAPAATHVREPRACAAALCSQGPRPVSRAWRRWGKPASSEEGAGGRVTANRQPPTANREMIIRLRSRDGLERIEVENSATLQAGWRLWQVFSETKGEHTTGTFMILLGFSRASAAVFQGPPPTLWEAAAGFVETKGSTQRAPPTSYAFNLAGGLSCSPAPMRSCCPACAVDFAAAPLLSCSIAPLLSCSTQRVLLGCSAAGVRRP